MSKIKLTPEDYYKTLSRKGGEIGIESSIRVTPYEYKELGASDIGGHEVIVYDAGNNQVGIHLNGLGNVDMVFSKEGLMLDYYQNL